MKTRFLWPLVALLFVVMCFGNVFARDELMIFCGAAYKKPMDEIIQRYMKKNNIDVRVICGGVGTLLSQITMSKRGDILMVPSSYIMEKAQSKGLVVPDSRKDFAYVVPVINVRKGNLKGIRSLADLAKPSVRVAIANPEIVFVGMLAAEIVEKSLTREDIKLLKKNIVTTPEDFNKLASALLLDKVDAIIGFHYLSSWYPDAIETIKLRPEEIQRIGAGQIGILSHSKMIEQAKDFQRFLLSAEG
ncbi:MAG TPA: extracellular solute-binding protein, partial [Syntrophorhabdus sp.]|nr:extracellular solute-binding protein [Syntrophorhabdus sp.]